MKRSVLFLVSLLVVTTMVAAPVSQQRAMQVAQQFIPVPDAQAQAPGMRAEEQPTSIVYTHPMPQSGRPAFYVVNVGGSFVIVSADDVAHQVLGYNLGKNWPVSGQLPPQVKGFFDDLAAQMEAAIEANPNHASDAEWSQPQSAPRRRMMSEMPDSVGPLLTTTWDQGQYYNALCPEDQNSPYDGHCPAGCVATAMAQIINYWGYPIHGRGIHSYDTNYGSLTVNYDSAHYDFAHMPVQLTNTSTPQEIQAVATLMRDCGVAANMGYGSGSSTAFDVDARAGLINFFRYSSNLNFAEKAFFTESEWGAMLKADISANRPILYSGHGTGDHTFVCDGYKQDGYYHLNFGWGGLCDAWYQLSVVNPAQNDFSSSQTALLGIFPDSTANVILGQMTGTSSFVVDDPLEFYHLLGNNAYAGNNYGNPCYNFINFISSDTTAQLVADILEFEDQILTIRDGIGNDLRRLFGGGENDLAPVVSSTGFNVEYSGNMYYAGFMLSISQDNGCRMVSNIVSSIDTTTVHLMWTENGTATQWQIEYGLEGFSHGEGTLITANNNIMDITFPQRLTKYDVYIRSICGNNSCGPWAKKTILSEAPYWQDIVKEQPAGYLLNEGTNTVEISSAEGFTWWVKTNRDKNAVLTSDIDLSGYKWGKAEFNNIHFNGNGYVVSNLYMNETTYELGLFSTINHCIIDNVGLENCHVKGDYRTGCLCGRVWNGEIKNCYVVNSRVEGTDYVGGLIGENDEGKIVNNYVNVNVIGNRWTGLMLGMSWCGTIRNCYSAGGLIMRSYCYNAGIVAYSTSGEISHCYSVNLPMGVIGYLGGTVVNDTSTFVRADGNWELLKPVAFDGVLVSDLISALNKGVELYNDSTYRTWMSDNSYINNGYPVFGEKYQVLCPNVSNVSIQNIKVGDDNAVAIGWSEEGTTMQHILRYRRHDMPDSAYTFVTLVQNPDTVYGIPLGYVYDFNVRAVCDTDLTSGWTETMQIVVDLPLWTDIVTECPSGYSEDTIGNIIISSAEGLAWLSLRVKEGYCNNQNVIQLTNDIDLAGYRWVPIGYQSPTQGSASRFCGVFDGNNYTISNLYINCNEIQYVGLFGFCEGATLQNVTISGGNVKNWNAYNPDVVGSGGLVGWANGTNIMNCNSSVDVSGVAHVGSLCGSVRSDYFPIVIQNCSATGNVEGREGSGGLVGWLYGDVTIKNSFATGNVTMQQQTEVNPWYVGGLVGNFMMSSAYNCYSTGSVDLNTNYTGDVIGCPYINTHIHYIYGQDIANPKIGLIGNDCEDIADTAHFHHNGDSITLITPVTVQGINYSNLLDALNAWVTYQNDPMLKTWVLDTITGYPVLDDFFVPSCYNPTELKVYNATVVGDTIIRTELSWNQEGTPNRWDVLYVAAGKSIDEGSVISVNCNPCVITGIPIGNPLDFYVKAVCNESDVSGWSKSYTYIPDKLRWTEVVTSQPDGYREDEDRNVFISSAEGLAWLSSITNDLNGNQGWSNNISKVYLESDIDLSAYRWTRMGFWYNCNFEGNGHAISGLFCNELSDNQGLFSYVGEGHIANLSLKNCVIRGVESVGTLAGSMYGVTIINCAVDGNVHGLQAVGGIIGQTGHCNIFNSYYEGTVFARKDITKINCIGGYIGGIIGNPEEDIIANCYLVSEIADTVSYSGIIAGTGRTPQKVTSCYFKSYPTNVQISNDCNTSNNSSFSGNGTAWILNTPPYVNGMFRTDLLDALNAWVDENNVDSIYRYWVADTAMVNGGFPIFAPMPVEPVGPITEIDNLKETNHPARKVFERGQLYILLPDGTRYDATGRKVK